MKIAIFGAGAMGSLYGGYLSKKHEVWMIDVFKPVVDAINAKGLDIDELDGTTTHVTPKATMNPEEVGVVDLAVVFVKSIHTASAMTGNKAVIGPNTAVLTLQNGYGNADDIMQFVPAEQVIVGTTSHGCTNIEPGHIFHAGVGPTHIGAVSEDQSVAQKIADALTEVGFPDVDCSPKVMRLVWSKLFANIAINPMCALLGVHNGFTNDNEYANKIANLLVREAVEVANATGMDFDPDEAVKTALDVAINTHANCCSMRADTIAKRQTEILKINGAVVKKAAEMGMKAPYNEMITNLILAKECTYEL